MKNHHNYLLGLGVSYDEKEKIAIIEQRNYFKIGSKIEIFNPSGKRFECVVEDLFDEDDQSIDVARHPKQLLKLHVPFEIEPYAMIRKII